MKITVYTTADDPFSKQEKDYLTSHSLQFEEKNLEANKEFLTEMLAVSNNFAGTPVTKVEKDDGTIAVLKGFTQADFDKTLGFAAAEPTGPQPVAPTSTPPTPTPPMPQPPTPTPTMPEPTPPPVTEPTPTMPPTPAAPEPTPTPPPTTPPETPTQSMPSNDALNSILEDLQKKAGATPTSAAPSTGAPSVPNFPTT